jgi:hypothetical protein
MMTRKVMRTLKKKHKRLIKKIKYLKPSRPMWHHLSTKIGEVSNTLASMEETYYYPKKKRKISKGKNRRDKGQFWTKQGWI